MDRRPIRMLAAIFALLLVAAACDSSDDESDVGAGDAADPTEQDDGDRTTGETGDAGGLAERFAISKVDFEAGVVLVTNVSDEPADPEGMFICNRPNYVPVPGGELAPGEAAEVALSDLSADAADGEAALYTEQDFANSEKIVSYVQWGGDEHGRTSVAVAAGLWEAGATIAGGASSIEATTDRPSAPDDWSADSGG